MRSTIMLATLIVATSAWAKESAEGQATYDKKCATCHGKDGHGNASKAKILKIDAKILDLGRPEAEAMSRADKRALVEKGKGKMPAYGKKLAAAQLDAVTDYAIALVSPKGATAAAPAAATTASAAVGDAKPLYDKKCASCHGKDGHGSAAKAKILKIDPSVLDFSRAEASKLTRDDRRKVVADGKGKMPAYGKKLKSAEIDALADYVTVLSGKH